MPAAKKNLTIEQGATWRDTFTLLQPAPIGTPIAAMLLVDLTGGLLTIGVLQGLQKCLAVQGWIKTIWTAYYERKAGTSTDTDFSIAGQCPFSVPELMAELGL